MHFTAVATALDKLNSLPEDTVYALTVTEESPIILNIYVPDLATRLFYRMLLHLNPYIRTDDPGFETYHFNDLELSIIEEPNDRRKVS